jgi:hypothetical protein
MPEVTPTVATPGALVNQNPPDGELPNAVVDPTHTPSEPVIVAGYGFTVTVIVEKQVAIPYVIVVVPSDMPVTIPVVGLTVPTAVLELLHVPPAVGFDRVVVAPRHAVGIPVIAPGDATTVMIAVSKQPPNAYVTIVVPGDTPVIMPLDEPMVATPVLLLVQLPPAVVLLRVTDELTQIVESPVIGAGLGFMVTTLVPVEVQVPLLNVAVYVIVDGLVIPVGCI